jgi:hypothetical protein
MIKVSFKESAGHLDQMVEVRWAPGVLSKERRD